MPANAGDAGLIPGSGRSPGEGNGKPLYYSCLENSMGREEPGGLQSTGSKESDVTERTNKLSLCAAHKHSISTVELTRISLCSF